MNEKIVVGEVEAEKVEVIDLGNAVLETKQYHPIHQINDSAFTMTYAG